MQALALKQTIPLPGVTGKFDHFAFDAAGQRLFAAATGHHSIEVIDVANNKTQQSITGLGKPHGLIWVASTKSLYVADGSRAELSVYQSSSDSQLKLAGTLKLSDDADDMTYNQANHLLFIGHGGGDSANPARIAVVDTDHFALLTDLPVTTHPEALEIDEQGQRIFANIAESSEIAVIDGTGKTIKAIWKLTKAHDNVPLAYNTTYQTLYVACRAPATLIALDATSGEEISSLPTGEGADDLFYDAALGRIYVISGAGQVDVYQVNPDKTLRSLGIIRTAIGAKTALFVPSQSALYVGIPGNAAQSAEIRIYSTVSK